VGNVFTKCVIRSRKSKRTYNTTTKRTYNTTTKRTYNTKTKRTYNTTIKRTYNTTTKRTYNTTTKRTYNTTTKRTYNTTTKRTYNTTNKRKKTKGQTMTLQNTTEKTNDWATWAHMKTGWTQVLWKANQFLFSYWHTSCYYYTTRTSCDIEIVLDTSVRK
jgi:hypothetical protein